MSRLEELLLRSRTPKASMSAVDRFFAAYGLGRNPFPPARTIWPEVLYDQDSAVEAFAGAVEAVLGPAPARRALAIVAGTGGGKTHFLRHAALMLGKRCEDEPQPFAVVEFAAGSGNIQVLVHDAFEAADKASRDRGETDFVTTLVDAVRGKGGREALKGVAPSDLREALGCLVEARGPNHRPADRDQRFTFEVLRSVFRRWLSGAALDQTERKYLRVTERIGTGSMAVRVLTGLLALGRRFEVLGGILLCLDEVETLFSGAQKMPAVQGFLQDLRYLFDASSHYGLLVLSAATANGARLLGELHQPMYQRLGFQSEARVELRPIEGTLEARKFADEYIQHERRRITSADKPPPAPPLLSDEDIAEAFRRAVGITLQRPGHATLSQGALLNALYTRVEEKRTAASRPAT
jgi:hypothetical protein